MIHGVLFKTNYPTQKDASSSFLARSRQTVAQMRL